jgi:hypothetical protein
VRHLWPEAPEGRVSDGSRELRFAAPSGWEQSEPQPMRAISFSFGEQSECYVAALAGTGGGVKANLDRWRAQLGGAPLGDEELAALPRVAMLGRLAPMIRIEGDYRGMRGDTIPGAVMLGAVCELEGETLFVKLLGPQAEVDARADELVAFCQGLR